MAQIVSKLKEAKGVKAYDTLQILAKNISQSYLLRLILPFKEVRSVRPNYVMAFLKTSFLILQILSSTKSFKMTRKVEECLQNVALGLSVNSGLAIEPLLILIHGVISLSIPDLRLPPPRKEQDPNLTASGRPMKSDSLIIAPVPKRKVAAAAQPSVSGASKSAYIINSHFLVEFGLLVFSLILKREKCHENANANIIPMLDPIVPIIYHNLNDPHSKVFILAIMYSTSNRILISFY